MNKDLSLGAFRFGSNIVKVEESEDMCVFHMSDNTGNGVMTLYHVFPGISLMYNDFHMAGCISEFHTDIPIIGIDHCREGRIEWEMPGGSFLYIQEGDLQIDSRPGNSQSFGFPLNHYHGITIAININEAGNSIGDLLSEFGINIDILYEQFCADKTSYIKRANESISHIFSELYSVKNHQRIYRFRVKILELLLFLHRLDPNEKELRTYFPRQQVNVVKEIMSFITKNLDKRYSVEYLSKKFNIPSTTLKICFKGVFGCPIAQYLREYRMNEAARMLKNRNETISIIASKVGYDNQSKFAAAFKAFKGKSPKEYRKIHVQME